MEEGSALPAPGLIWPGGVVQGKSSGHPYHVSWIPWHFLLEAWRVRLYQPSKRWNQSCWWWKLQRVVPKESPTHGGWCLGTCEGDVGSRHYLPQSKPWCNAVILVFKKEGCLCFCIDFCKLNVRTKKDSYPLPQIQDAIESLVGVGYFCYLSLKAGFWQIATDEVLKQYTAFTVGNLRFFKCECMQFTFARLLDSLLALNIKRDRKMQPQMPWAKSHQSWMQEPWSPSWRKSLWEQ